MDLITQTSLEALLLKATNPQNQNIDTAAVEAFYTLINKEKDGSHIGVKVIANKLPSGNEKELLQTLNVLDTCMAKCGTHFQNEVGKFRFLNEMIKLVSPKYLGSHTPLAVKQKVLQLMYVWTLDYPKETKIKEAFDMLRKQGVIREIPNPNIAIDTNNIPKRKPVNSIFHDEEKSKILQKLLQSKDPEDIQAANWLIKSMVKEDDKRAEMKSRRISELESVQNNVRLLNEMLDSYKPGNPEEDLITELHQSCQRLKPNILKLAQETQQNEEMLVDILRASDELSQVFQKYEMIIVQGKSPQRAENCLLDFDMTGKVFTENNASQKDEEKNTMDVLCDIFTSTNIPDNADVLQPITVLNCDKSDDCKEKPDKLNALEDLDVLSEQLIKENLGKQSNFKNQDKVPMNLLTKINEIKQSTVEKQNVLQDLDLTCLLSKSKENKNVPVETNEARSISQETDDFLVDISDEKMLDSSDVDSNAENNVNETKDVRKNNIENSNIKNDINLKEIYVQLTEIKPSSIPPVTVLDERSGLGVTLHYAKDKPKENVHVYVLTAVSKNELPITNYLCQAVAPKGCKLKLQAPSSNDLPAYNPFLPPSAITQIMLLVNQSNIPSVSIKFIVSYVIDEETVTEMGEVKNIPMIG